MPKESKTEGGGSKCFFLTLFSEGLDSGRSVWRGGLEEEDEEAGEGSGVCVKLWLGRGTWGL